MEALVLAFCCGLPGSMRSERMPSFSHHTLSWLNPATALDEKGVPLSERITFGRPCSRNTISKPRLASSRRVLLSALQHSAYRLHWSVTVRGSQRSPFPSRNQPL